MKLESYPINAPTVTGYGPGWIKVNGTRFESSVLLQSTGSVALWSCAQLADLNEAHFKELALLRPAVVLFGSGAQLRFPQRQWLQPLITQGIGVETMDTLAACRTYNLLAGEGRHVVAALLIEPVV